MNNPFMLLPVVLLAIFTAGCSGLTAVEEAEVRQAFGVPAGMPLKDLGPVRLHPGAPKRVSLGGGDFCTITLASLPDGPLQLDVRYDFADIQNDSAAGIEPPFVFRPDQVPAHWRLCLMPPNRNFAVALRPVIIP